MTVIAFPGTNRPDADVPSGPASVSAEEGLRLIQAFIKIGDSELRAQLIRLAERFSVQDGQGSR